MAIQLTFSLTRVLSSLSSRLLHNLHLHRPHSPKGVSSQVTYTLQLLGANDWIPGEAFSGLEGYDSCLIPLASSRGWFYVLTTVVHIYSKVCFAETWKITSRKREKLWKPWNTRVVYICTCTNSIFGDPCPLICSFPGKINSLLFFFNFQH